MKVWRIGYLSNSAHSAADEAFEISLQQLGWVIDRNIKIEYRYTGGRQDKVASIVADVVGLNSDLLVAWGHPLALSAMQAAPQSPLIFLVSSDPIANGLVSNLARPAGMVTGITVASEQLFAKRLELLKEAVPSLARVAVLFSTELRSSGNIAALRASARTLGLELADIEVESLSGLEDVVRRAKERSAQAVYVWPHGFTYELAEQICNIVTANSLPSIYPYNEGVFSGCLIAYSYDVIEQARRGAAYVDKILRGAQPGSLPVEQLSKYELVINLNTAKKLGLTLPPSLLARTDQVIE
jgi:putative tryptophan/tyrosine transport system substrate-binding protein